MKIMMSIVSLIILNIGLFAGNINKNYIDSLSNGNSAKWYNLGTDSQITDLTIFNNTYLVWVYKNNSWYAYSSVESAMNKINSLNYNTFSSIEPNQGFWVLKDIPSLGEYTNISGGNGFTPTFMNSLPEGWNFIATDSNISNLSILSDRIKYLWLYDENDVWKLYAKGIVNEINNIPANRAIWVLISDSVLISNVNLTASGREVSFSINLDQQKDNGISYSIKNGANSLYNDINSSGSFILDYGDYNLTVCAKIIDNGNENCKDTEFSLSIDGITVPEKPLIGTITFKGKPYGTIESPITHRVWLDRNLGASKACDKGRNEFSSDSEYITSQQECFGDYYQWGRLADGHEDYNSSTTSVQSTNLLNSGSSFILSTYNDSNADWANSIDSDGAKRTAQWSTSSGSSICPNGFRVPSIDELKKETLDYPLENNELTGAVKVVSGVSAFKNFLKLPLSGNRSNQATLTPGGFIGNLWSSSSSAETAPAIPYFSKAIDYREGFAPSAMETSPYRANAYPVRCIKDLDTIEFKGKTYKEVKSPISGRIWLDRNLGASKVCDKSMNDFVYGGDFLVSQEECIGDYYQWGRLTDGHQELTSVVSQFSPSSISDAGSYFSDALGRTEVKNDWAYDADINGSLRETQWSNSYGASICPSGFRVPSISELAAETINYSLTDNESSGAVKVTDGSSAIKNFLKLAGASMRTVDGRIHEGTTISSIYPGHYWTSTSKITPDSLGNYSSYSLFFPQLEGEGYLPEIKESYRANAFLVRCIKD